MEAYERQIEYYETESGEQPFRNWLLSLKDKEYKRRILIQINRIRVGNLGNCKSVGEGVMELKINFGPGYRIYFGQIENKIVILLNGGDKSSQKTDIKVAKTYWANYRRSYE